MLYNATLMWLLALLWKVDPMNSRVSDEIRFCAHRAMETASNYATMTDPSRAPSPPYITRNVSFEPLRRPGQSTDLREPAIEIGRAFEWLSRNHQRPDNTELNPLYLFPVGMAMSVLDPAGRAWIQRLLNASPFTRTYGGSAAQQPNRRPPETTTAAEEEGVKEVHENEDSARQARTDEQQAKPPRPKGIRRGKAVAGFGFYVTREALRPNTGVGVSA
jgi:hypothetical protein